MKERWVVLLSWIGFLSLLLGVLPLMSMTTGYQLEERQHKPNFGQWQCDQLANDPGYQNTLKAYTENPDRFHEAGIRIEEFDAQKCRIAGSGEVTAWLQEGSGMGFIYAKLPEREMLHRLGYRTFFHELSEDRWLYTAIIAIPWLPIMLLIYFWTGSVRILPWWHRAQTEDQDKGVC